MSKRELGASSTSRMSPAKRRELQQQTLVFHVCSPHTVDFFCTVELGALQSFRDLHLALCRALRQDPDFWYAFYLSGEAFKGTAYISDRNPNVTLHEGGCKFDKQFLYVCDKTDSGFITKLLIHVQRTATRQPDTEYPRVIAQAGDPATVFATAHSDSRGTVQVPSAEPLEPDLALDLDLLPLANELLERCQSEDDCEDLQHQDCRYCDANPGAQFLGIPAARVEGACALIARLCSALRHRPQQLHVLERHCDFLLVDWMSGVVTTLHHLGRSAEALALAEELDHMDEEEFWDFLPGRPFLLLGAGRKPEALALMTEEMQDGSHHPPTLQRAVAFFRAAGELHVATHYARCLVELDATPSWFVRRAPLLLEVLSESGAAQEASVLRDRIDEVTQELARYAKQEQLTAQSLRERPDALPYRAQPKPSRNDPCPCGSGKKWKKCCESRSMLTSHG